MNTKHVRLIFFVFVLTALVAGLVPMATAAEAPSINVAPVWPATTLTSLDENGTAFPTWDTDDDYRYVSAELYVTTTVEFWAMDMACTVDSRYLTSYVWDDTNATGDWGDDQQPIWWNDSVWNGNNGSYVAYEPAPTFNALANTMTVKATVSREGNQANAIGRNGQQTTLQLGALTFLVTETAGQSPLNCSFTFLDRDGNAVLRRSGYTAPPPLTTTEGFIVEGHATHQVHTRTNGIGVTCQVDGDPGTQETTTTDRNGYYKLPPIREEGHLDCWYEGNVTVPNADLYITRDINMSMSDRHSYYFLPVELLSGNLDNVNECGALGWYHQCVDDWDIQKVTTNWELNNNGDANGDGLTNKADLAIVAGNYYIHETWSVNHALYSLARSFTDTAMDNRVWVGDNNSGPVSQLVPPGRGTRDFWATMSPDGRTVAFVRASTPRGATYPNYELYKMDVPSGRVSQLLSKAQAGNMDAFAPSWSPDGSQIAFNCASSRGIVPPGLPPGIDVLIPYSGYMVNGAGICLVDANGRNFREIVGQENATIYPPAWIGGWEIVFGGTPENDVCEDTLCVYHLSWSDPLQLFDDDVDAAGRFEDRPVSMHSRLFYRSTDETSIDSELRYVDSIDMNCPMGVCNYVTAAFVDRTTQAGNAYRPNPVHTNVTYCTDADGNCHDGSYSFSPVDANDHPGITGDIDFYDIRYQTVMLYGEFNDNFWHADYKGEVDDDVSGPCAPGHKCWPEWWGPWSTYVDSYVGAPYWSGYEDDPTDLHAERPTFDLPQ